MLSNDHIEQLPFPLNVVATKTNVSVMIVDGVKCVGIADMYFVDDHWWLARLNVHRDYRQNGYGKRTAISEYRLIRRGGSGVKNIICSERNGKAVNILSVIDEDDVMFISQSGVIIRTQVSGISTIGRSTQGVRIMKLADGDKVASAASI